MVLRILQNSFEPVCKITALGALHTSSSFLWSSDGGDGAATSTTAAAAAALVDIRTLFSTSPSLFEMATLQAAAAVGGEFSGGAPLEAATGRAGRRGFDEETTELVLATNLGLSLGGSSLLRGFRLDLPLCCDHMHGKRETKAETHESGHPQWNTSKAKQGTRLNAFISYGRQG
jgi:hypothetical protein